VHPACRWLHRHRRHHRDGNHRRLPGHRAGNHHRYRHRDHRAGSHHRYRHRGHCAGSHHRRLPACRRHGDHPARHRGQRSRRAGADGRTPSPGWAAAASCRGWAAGRLHPPDRPAGRHPAGAASPRGCLSLPARSDHSAGARLAAAREHRCRRRRDCCRAGGHADPAWGLPDERVRPGHRPAPPVPARPAAPARPGARMLPAEESPTGEHRAGKYQAGKYRAAERRAGEPPAGPGQGRPAAPGQGRPAAPAPRGPPEPSPPAAPAPG
jgi:hypothetical protein